MLKEGGGRWPQYLLLRWVVTKRMSRPNWTKSWSQLPSFISCGLRYQTKKYLCVCDCVWLSVINTTLMTWVNIPLLDQWQWQRQSLSEISPQWRRTGRTLPREPRTLQQNNSQFSEALAAVFLSSSYRDDSGDCLQKILTSWRWWGSLEILVLASVYSSFPNTAPPAYKSRDV